MYTSDQCRLTQYALQGISFFDIVISMFAVYAKKTSAPERTGLMKNYMNRWVLLALKAIVILVWLACLWANYSPYRD